MGFGAHRDKSDQEMSKTSREAGKYLKLSFLRHSFLTVLVSALNDMAEDSGDVNINNQSFNLCGRSQRTEEFLFQRFSTAYIYHQFREKQNFDGISSCCHIFLLVKLNARTLNSMTTLI